MDLTTGDRVIVSDFGNPAQGPTGDGPSDVTLDGSGNALVVDRNGGTNGRGALYSVDLATGDRVIVSDFGDGAQGPLGSFPSGVTLEDSNNALVIDERAGTNSDGALFRINLTTGDRIVVSDFGDGAHGPTGINTVDVTLDNLGNALVLDQITGLGLDGILFRVNLTTGDRVVVSDFGDSAQGPLGLNPSGVTIYTLYTPDLSVVKSGFPNPVTVNEALTYSLFVINNGEGAATNVTLTDTLPSGVTFVSAPGCTELSGVVTCDLGTMVMGDIQQVDITVTAPSDPGAILNIAEVTSDEEDAQPSDNRTEEITQVVNAPIPPDTSELLIIKSDSPDPVVVGNTLSYNLFVANLGPNDATNVVVTDILPAGVTFDSAQGCAEMGGGVTCIVGALANGAVASFTINVTTDSTGILFNVAQVSGDQLDPAPGNNVAGETTTVVDVPVVVPMADLFVQKTDSPDPVLVGNETTYSIFVTNFGPDTAEDVTLTDTLPPDTTFVSAPGCAESTGVVTCDLGDLTNGQNTVVTVTVTADAEETIFDIAQVDSVTEDPNPFNNMSVESTLVVTAPIVVPRADLQVIKSDSPDPVIVEDTLSYEIVAINSGPDEATGVVVTDTLPPGVTFLSATPQQGACNEAGGVITCELGNLASGAFTQVDIQLIPENTGAIVNIAQIEGNELDPITSNNTSAQTTTVNEYEPDGPSGNGGGGGAADGPDIFVMEFVSPNPAEVGDEIRYTIFVGNLGSFGTPVTLTDILPEGLEFVSVSSSQGSCSETGGTVTCLLGTVDTIDAGLLVTVELVVRAEQTGTLPNIAQLSGSANDPNTTNNVAIVAVEVVGDGTGADTGGDDGKDPGVITGDDSGTSNGCALAGSSNYKNTALNFAVLLLPLLWLGIRTVRKRR